MFRRAAIHDYQVKHAPERKCDVGADVSVAAFVEHLEMLAICLKELALQIRRTVSVFTLFLALPLLGCENTDVIFMQNGDRIAGRSKRSMLVCCM
jgi:hypothetical protein